MTKYLALKSGRIYLSLFQVLRESSTLLALARKIIFFCGVLSDVKLDKESS